MESAKIGEILAAAADFYSGLYFTGTVLVIGVAILTIIVTKKIAYSRKMARIPSVKGGLPFFGQVFDMIKGSPWDMMTKWSLKYGPIYKFHLFGSDAVAISDPDLLRVVLQTKLPIFKKDRAWTYKPFLVLLGEGIVSSDGASWRRQRTFLSSHLRLEILDFIPDFAFRAFQRFSKKLNNAAKENRPLEMAEEFRHLTLQVISEALFSMTSEESDKTFATMYLPIVEEGNLRTWHPERMYLPTPSFFKFQRDVKILNDYVTSLITKRWALRQKEKLQSDVTRKTDVLDKTLSAYTVEEWTPAAINQVRDEMKTFVLAGHETSASMLAWTLFELTQNPACLKRVRDEMRSVFQGHIDATTGVVTGYPSRTALQEGLQYTECCLRESLRKYSVVPTVVRVCSEDVEVGEYHLPKGMTVMVNIQGAHHDPKLWPEPQVYNPDRFLIELQPFTFLPFIDGPRVCLGQFLSLLESKIVLSLLVHHYHFDVVNAMAAQERHPFMVPIIPKTGHYMMISKR